MRQEREELRLPFASRADHQKVNATRFQQRNPWIVLYIITYQYFPGAFLFVFNIEVQIPHQAARNVRLLCGLFAACINSLVHQAGTTMLPLFGTLIYGLSALFVK